LWGGHSIPISGSLDAFTDNVMGDLTPSEEGSVEDVAFSMRYSWEGVMQSSMTGY